MPVSGSYFDGKDAYLNMKVIVQTERTSGPLGSNASPQHEGEENQNHEPEAAGTMRPGRQRVPVLEGLSSRHPAAAGT